MKIKYFLLFWLGVFSMNVFSQTLIPKMKISNESNSNPMILQELDMDIYIVGQTAVTTVEMVFYNPNNRIMEGEFEFPLSDGQQVSRFALDIEGKLREAVVVDKKQGRVAFESITRRRVDPGLLEKTEGNNFKARVYPMPARGTRRILIAFEQELSTKDGKDSYFLPIKSEIKLKKFHLKAEIVSKEVEIDTENSLNLEFKHWRNSYISEISKTDFTLSKNIVLTFPNVEKPEILTASQTNKTYFYGNIPLKIISERKQFPKKIGILWDASSSSEKRDFEKEFQLLDAYFQEIKNVQVQVNTFDIQASKSTTFSVKNGNWGQLKQFLKAVTYDGATDLEAMTFDQKNDEFLLFTDGIFNFGENENIFELTKRIKRPVYVINSNIIANTDKLKYLTYWTGANYIDLTQNSVQKSKENLLQLPYRLVNVKVNSGKIANMYPSQGAIVSDKFIFSGELLTDEAKVTLYFGVGNQIFENKEITIVKKTNDLTKEFTLLRRIWAEKKIAQMRLEGKNQDDIDAIGKEYGIVTEGTSLIVLETVEDYVRYKIVPPAELQDKYYSLLSREKQEEIKKNDNIAYVIEESDKQTKWWKTNYPIKGTKPKKQKEYEETPVVGYEMMSEAVLSDEGAQIREVVVTSTSALKRSVVTKSAKAFQEDSKNIDIQLNEWNPDTPYLKVLQYTDAEKNYETYINLKKEYGQTPSFYVDVADYFFKKGKCEIAVKVISNLAEINLEEVQILRILGYKLTQYETPKYAISTFRKVLKLREEEPQSYRDLGLALAQNKQYNEAVKTLYKVVSKDWDRFSGIKLIVMNEINNIINTQKNVDTSFINKKLLKNEPVDIRVILTWDTDNSDMDLWVTDPKGEKCSYSNKLTYLGGKISNDFTQGYGPEEFMIKKALKGEYKIEANYFGSRSQKQLFPVSLRLEFFTNYGKPNQSKREVVVRLSNNAEVIDIGKFVY